MKSNDFYSKMHALASFEPFCVKPRGEKPESLGLR